MIALARWLMKGPWQASGLIAFTGVVALLVPLVFPLAILSGGAITLVTLKLGPQRGFQVVAYALLASIALLLLIGNPGAAFGLGVVFWIPLLLASVLLGFTARLSWALLSVVGFGLLVVALQHLVLGDPTAYWEEWLSGVWETWLAQSQSPTPEGMDVEELIALQARAATGALAVVLMALQAGSLLLGRYWHGKLYGGIELGMELRTLSLGRGPALFALGVLALGMFVTQDWLLHVLSVMIAAYLFQGLVIVHVLAGRYRVHAVWLVLLYFSLFVFPYVSVMIALGGLADTWVGIRQRLSGPGPRRPDDDSEA